MHGLLSTANTGHSTVNYCQSSAFDWPILSCNDHCDCPHEKINQCLTDINRCLTDIFKI